jgi:hypothetical protein
LGLATYVLSAKASGLDVRGTAAVQRAVSYVREHWPTRTTTWRLTDVWCGVVEVAPLVAALGRLSAEETFLPGARKMIRAQRSDGSWGCGMPASARAGATSTALLFLTRAHIALVSGSASVPSPVTLTRTERFPALDRPEDLPSAFARYVGYPPLRQREVMRRFGRVGGPVLAFLVGKLRDRDIRVRTTAFKLLGMLTAMPLAFDPRAPEEVRAAQVAAIEQEQADTWVCLTWNVRQQRFRLPRRVVGR